VKRRPARNKNATLEMRAKMQVRAATGPQHGELADA
jgi:hypothetical protein